MIYLLRHGEIDSGGKKRFTGQLDLSLTEKGRLQAESWKKELSCIKFDYVYSSDLTRCVETVRIITGSENSVLIKELREIYLGEWEGLSFDEVKAERKQQWEERGQNITGYRPPAGESFNDLKKRVIPAFSKIAEENKGNILIVTHAGVIRTIICHLLEIPFRRLFSLGLGYSGMYIVDNNADPVQLIAANKLI
ncbi:MAG: histidine phosphatase family protein [Spirochaetes bacterium]|nr:histidine phosphatase family protein [Spirochaetota bacterium]